MSLPSSSWESADGSLKHLINLGNLWYKFHPLSNYLVLWSREDVASEGAAHFPSHFLDWAWSLCFRHKSYISNHPDFLLLPTPTGNEKYETFLNQARENLEKEYNKYETFVHSDVTEEVPEDESPEVPLASPCAEWMWQDGMCEGPEARRT